MSSPDNLVQAWIGLGWLWLLVFTLATCLVGVLRRPCRAWLGAERAYQLWLLPPLALLATRIPHPAAALPPLPPVVLTLTAMPHALPVAAGPSMQAGWPAGLLVLWLLGAFGVCVVSWQAQRRYRRGLAGAERMQAPSLRWPVWRSPDRATGPATVGAWRPCIVLPVDFETRYDECERTLILAHEACHARRGDGRWMLCAQVLVAMFWFHPLAWWALRAFRRDQELACDAAVLRDRHGQRRTYAQAMLKTQWATCALPVGCCWLPHHPITERIAMLNRNQPSLVRRRAGAAFLALITASLAGVVFAASQPSSGMEAKAAASTASRYTLKLEVGIDGQPARLHATSCLRPGQFYETLQGGIDPLPPWDARFTVVPTADGLLEVQAQLSGGTLDHVVYPKIRTHPGQQAAIVVGRQSQDTAGRVAGNHTFKADLTPSIGC